MASNEVMKIRLKTKTKMLEEAYKAYEKLLSGGVKSYAIGSRNMTKFDLPALENTIKSLEKEVDQLERMISGGARRKTVVVVMRDL